MAEYLKQAFDRPRELDEKIKRTVSEMLLRIEQLGMDAVRQYSRDLDGWDPPSFRVSREEVEAAASRLTPELRRHIGFAQEQVASFAERQRMTLTDLRFESQPGVELGHTHVPVGAVGAYVPGGQYPMLASAFMTVLVPKVAAVPRVVACAPPWRGSGIHPAMLFSIATSGADEILCLGGVQAIATLALGVGDVDPVDMVVGPGNAYVAEAKRQLFGRVGIDLLAGPTEILVIADDSADPELVAADLLGQAEHGPTSPATLVSLSRKLGAEVLRQIARLLDGEPASATVAIAWREHGSAIVVQDHAEAIAVANTFAPEHVEVQVAETELPRYLRELTNYGSLFLGAEATVVYGDKAVGTNHVLPTRGAARYTGGLWVGKFLKTLTYQRLTEEGTRLIAPVAAAISEAELFPWHARTAELRLRRLDDEPTRATTQANRSQNVR